ncbi:MAG: EAL domain-containing protein [Candidatus Sedimenticola sp. PURPLELP]
MKRNIVLNLLIAIAYVAVAQLGLMFAVVEQSITLVWPPTGLALAVIFRFGYTAWPGLVAGAFIANAISPAPLGFAFFTALGNPLPAVCAYYLLTLHTKFDFQFRKLSDLLWFLLIPVTLTTTLSAAIGVSGLWITGVIPTAAVVKAASIWWIGDGMGVLLFAPLLMLLSRSHWSDAGERARTWGWLAVAMVTLISWGVFLEGFGHDVSHQLTYTVLPPAIWIALHFRQSGAALSTLIITLFSVTSATMGVGPFGEGDMTLNLIQLHGFLSVASVTLLTLGITTDINRQSQGELAEAYEELKQYQTHLMDLVTERTRALSESEERLRNAQRIARLGNWDWDMTRDKLICSSDIHDILGIEHRPLYAFDDLMRSLHPDDREEVQAAIDSALKGEPLDIEHRIVLPDGSIRFIHQLGEATLGDEGFPLRFQATFSDITERQAAEEEHRLAMAVYESTIEGVMITDARINIIAVNRAFTDITGYSEEEAVGTSPGLLSSGRENENFYKQMWKSLNSVGRWQGEISNRRKSGELYPEWLTISEVRNNKDEITNYVGVFADITTLKESQNKLEHMAHHDTLTGLPNRLLFTARLDHSITVCKREKREMAVLFMDLDRFKHVNDTLGHPAGDTLLQSVAQRLTQCVRASDTVARLGGDEFVTILEGVTGDQDTSRIAKKIIHAMTEPFTVDGTSLYIGASIGISLYPTDGTDATTLLKNADLAMYQSKEAGRNTYHFFNRSMSQNTIDRFNLEGELHKAIEEEEFVVHYQPQFELSTGRCVGVEALVRWQHPEQGLVTPARFISVAEESGLLLQIDQFVLATACRQLKRWREQELNLPLVAVNVAGRQLESESFLDTVTEVLEENGLSGESLELEICENYIMRQPAQTISLLKKLREIGVRIAIDDFGTGQTSLGQLKSIPIDTLKVDQSFVHDLHTDSDNAAIVSAVNALGTNLGYQIIAEGVETEDEMHVLQRQGYLIGQGYLYGRPIDADTLTEQLADMLASRV